MAGGRKRKGAKAGTTNKKKQRQAEQTADEEQKQVELPIVTAPPISRLYRDALQSIFKFCRLSDLGRIITVSRNWSETVRLMPSIGASVILHPVPCPAIVTSGLSTHVSSIGEEDSRVDLSCDALFILASLPSLTRVRCAVTMIRAAPLLFARGLKSLDLRFEGAEATATALNAVIVTSSQLPKLTELTLSIPSYSAELSFAALLAAPKLMSLQLLPPGTTSAGDFTSDQLNQLRSLRSLSMMWIARMSKRSFAELLRPPHQLQWQHVVGPDSEVGAVEAALLAALPLTDLHIRKDCSDVSFLPPLSASLRRLRLGATPDVFAVDVVAGLSSCAGLTELSLNDAQVTCAHLTQLFPCLPRLTKLRLFGCNRLKSFRCFSDCKSIRQSLLSLSLLNCDHPSLHPRDIKLLQPLRNLTFLSIVACFEGRRPLDSALVALLTPPTLIFPALTEFVHDATDSDDEDDDDEDDEEEED